MKSCITILAALSFGVAHAATPPPNVSAKEAAALTFAPTATRSLPARPPVVTRHATTVSGQRIPYQAIVSEWPVPGADGQPIGVIVTEAYVAQGQHAGSRPVTFIYNGGPGASSWSLQMEGFGPRAYQPAKGKYVDNPDSLIDVSDLVFIDPLGTGASFPLQNRHASSAWNTPGDARTVLDVMAGWLAANNRTASPQFLLGESYGTMRSLAIMHADAKRHALHINGIILLSLFLNTAENQDINAIQLLPSMAATAYERGVRPAPASSVGDAYEQAMVFARSIYADALIQGSRLPSATLHAVAEQMSKQVGISPGALESAKLRIDRTAFAHALPMAGDHRHAGSLDTRQTGGPELDALPAPYNDPSMSLGKRPASLVADYMKWLGYSLAGPYRYLNLAINRGNWYFSSRAPGDGDDDHLDTVPWLADAMSADTCLRVFTAGGYFDTNTPVGVGIYELSHADIDPKRWTAKVYPSGHGIAEDPVQRTVLAGDLRAFIGQTCAR